MRKFTGTEGRAKVLSPNQHKTISKALGKIGKTSAEALTDDERKDFISSLESDK